MMHAWWFWLAMIVGPFPLCMSLVWLTMFMSRRGAAVYVELMGGVCGWLSILAGLMFIASWFVVFFGPWPWWFILMWFLVSVSWGSNMTGWTATAKKLQTPS